MPLHLRFPFLCVRRPILVMAFLFAWTGSAFADPRLVRVIWDVGGEKVYTKVEDLVELGHDVFLVPKTADDAKGTGFKLYAGLQVLRRGDRVRIYVVNYNAVSHVWHESSVVEQIAREPSLVGPILSAAILAITGAGKLPAVLPPVGALAIPADSTPCPSLNGVRDKLDALRTAARDLYTGVTVAVNEARNQKLPEAARMLARVPTHPKMWEEFRNAEAWQLILRDEEVFGFNFKTRFATLAEKFNAADALIDAANTALLAFDHEVAKGPIPDNCHDIAKALLAQRDNIVTLIEELAGEDSPLQAMQTIFQNGNALWSSYQRKLTGDAWRTEAIELVVKDAIKADVVLRVDAVFQSPEKTFTTRVQKNVVLGVETFHPALVISSGVAFNGFDFQQLQVTKVPFTGDDNKTITRNKLELTDDTAWDPIVPVWLQSVRMYAKSGAGIYGTFGTTPDRNIFKNGIAGISLFVPRWRTMFTGGIIAARGYEAEDLEPVIKDYSDANGFALADVTATNLPLPKKGWKRTWYFSVTFGLASF
jgi:hypothetical protein